MKTTIRKINGPNALAPLLYLATILSNVCGLSTPAHSRALDDTLYSSDPKQVQRLLDAGEDPNRLSRVGTPLIAAIIRGRLEIVRIMIPYVSDINTHLDQDGYTALHVAARTTHVDIVNLLITAGADVNIEVKGGITPLHEAATHSTSNVHVVAALIQSGAKVDQQSSRGLTPLHLAADSHAHEIAKHLLESGANPNATTGSGVTPLHLAVSYSSSSDVSILKILIDGGARVDSLASNGSTPLHYAADTGSKERVQFLVENGAEINLRNKRDATPLNYAFENRDNRVAQYLKEVGAKYNQVMELEQMLFHRPLWYLSNILDSYSRFVADATNRGRKGALYQIRYLILGLVPLIALLLSVRYLWPRTRMYRRLVETKKSSALSNGEGHLAKCQNCGEVRHGDYCTVHFGRVADQRVHGSTGGTSWSYETHIQYDILGKEEVFLCHYCVLLEGLEQDTRARREMLVGLWGFVILFLLISLSLATSEPYNYLVILLMMFTVLPFLFVKGEDGGASNLGKIWIGLCSLFIFNKEHYSYVVATAHLYGKHREIYEFGEEGEAVGKLRYWSDLEYQIRFSGK